MKPSELLSDPSKWTKGAFARDADRENVDEEDEDAVCWCVMGAMEKCGIDCVRDPIVAVLETFIDEDLDIWNDAPERTYEDVIAALKAVGL